ncbi:TPA: hypothetical protein ACGW7H_005893 [Bacillus nitratireducens]
MRKREIAEQLKKFDVGLGTGARMLYVSLLLTDSSGKEITYSTFTEWTGLKSAEALKKAISELENAKMIQTKRTQYGVVYTVL